jgi:hypothetical protein
MGPFEDAAEHGQQVGAATDADAARTDGRWYDRDFRCRGSELENSGSIQKWNQVVS